MKLHGQIGSHADNGILIRCQIDSEELQKRIDKCGGNVEITMLDNRLISYDQRKKIYATFKDIADFMGEYTFGGMDYVKNFLKGMFIEAYKEDKDFGWFSLSDCSMELAYYFTDYLIEFCFEHNIPTMETLAARYADIERYMYICLKYKKCAVCNAPGEQHHTDVIGMGNNRKTMNDSTHRKICLCREHHQMAHNMGWSDFAKRYHVKGIIYKEVA